ncbi:HD domain-containing protein [Butyrivibrio sp. VCD2006]|uniref:HD domain-containing protein n=1 Tax=Butyrivibrio sp. VCD2006 TaxID=1280664 RepID=UPI0004080719|nr:HD domain-containing protein [Butyrivibrio sp. VCD2006]
MNIDRKRVREQFAAYTKNYDPDNTLIALKIIHTYKVADNCECIAESLGLSDDDIEFSWLSGMLHDIGRFEQLRRYNTFVDAKSIDHAAFGADLLFGEERLTDLFTDDRSIDDMLETVIRQHNKYRIDENITDKALMFCNILRDADKIDIFRVIVDTPPEELFNEPMEQLVTAEVTPSALEQVMAHQAVLRTPTLTTADRQIGHIGMAFELVYPKSRELTMEQGNLYKLFDFPTQNESMKNALTVIRKEIDLFFED